MKDYFTKSDERDFLHIFGFGKNKNIQTRELMVKLGEISQRICDLHKCEDCPLNQGDNKCPFCGKLIGFNYCDYLRGCAENPYYKCKICGGRKNAVSSTE